MGRNYGLPQGVKGSLQPASSKEMKQMQGTEFCQQLHELGSGSFHRRVLNETTSLADILIAAL